MKIENMQIFIDTVEQGSITKAADALYTSKQNLGAILKGVEEETGKTLLIRNKAGITLTEDGVEFLLYAREITYLYNQFMNSNTHEKKGERLVDFYTTPRLMLHMPEIQKLLYKKGIQISVHIVDGAQLKQNIREEKEGLYVYAESDENCYLGEKMWKENIAEDESIVIICHNSNPILAAGSNMRREIESGIMILYEEDTVSSANLVKSVMPTEKCVYVREIETAKFLMKERSFIYAAPYSFFRAEFDRSEFQILPFTIPIAIRYMIGIVGELDLTELQYQEITNTVKGIFRA